jgi:hypothetical protein
MSLHDPNHPESIPPEGRDFSPAPGNPGYPMLLSPAALTALQQSLGRQQRRRQVYRVQHLRVYLDGLEQWQVDPRVGVCEPFHVPLSASYLEIFGDDAEGRSSWRSFRCPTRRSRRPTARST